MFAVGIAKFDLNGTWYVALMFIYALIFSSIFAVFLPRLINERISNPDNAIQKMKVLYSMELAGFAVGFAIVSLSWNKGVEFIIPIYWVLLAIVIQLALQKKSWTVAFVLIAVIAGSSIKHIDLRTTALFLDTNTTSIKRKPCFPSTPPTRRSK